MNNKVYIFDTTLRDGEQAPGASMSKKEKLEIALNLEKLSVDIIEAGFPASSIEDSLAVQEICKKIKKSKIAVLARSNKNDIDKCVEALINPEKSRIHTFISTSPLHVKFKLKMNFTEVLSSIKKNVEYARRFCPEVEWSSEDATRTDFDFLCKAIELAINSGARIITIADTVGYTTPDEFYELIVIDSNYHPIGTVPLNILLRAKRLESVTKIMQPIRELITVDMDQEEVAYIFQQYDLVSSPVIDGNDKLIGVIMHDDIVDVITEEAEDDIFRLARAGDAGINDTFFVITKNRFMWLSVNLVTAIIASYVIFLFDATIEQLVALAVLMPIVASMGGNAGTQTLTVTVRALATKDITYSNAWRFINKEMLVALFNGVMFALIISVASWVWFSNSGLSFVIFIAMIINMLAAGLSGIVIPLLLNKIGADPALAATVFVTTVTDVIGFFAFLGLAALVLI